MDWKQILSESPNDWNDQKKEIIYENIITLKKDNILKKNYRKLFEISQHLLNYKGESIKILLANEVSRSSIVDVQQQEKAQIIKELNEKIQLLESNKAQSVIKILELSKENEVLRKKQQDQRNQYDNISNNVIAEDDDSPDVLSEVDRQEELLKNISMKNKHIKKLLRDVEMLEKANIEKSKIINDLQNKLFDSTENLTSIINQLTEKDLRINEQDNIIKDLNENITNLNEYIQKYIKENSQLEQEVNNFGKQLEERAVMWRQAIQEKETKLWNLQIKYEEILEQNPGYDIDCERIEFKRLCETLKERNEIIEELQSKLINITNEMITSTKVMNSLANNHESKRNSIVMNVKGCCDETRLLLDRSNKRCKELQDMMTKIEEDNIYKSKQAMDAMETLRTYQSGDEGLTRILKKNSEMQSKINARDKQMKTLIMELNTLQDTAHENYILRKRLGISETDVIPTQSYIAKEKKLQKVINRLIQKLRASEEMRLQLKLEKNNLRRTIRQPKISKKKSDDENENSDNNEITEMYNNDYGEIKFCENCLKQYEVMDIFKSCKNCIMKFNCNFCTDCQVVLKIGTLDTEKELNKKLGEYDKKYTEVIEENENLRIGLHEIVEKLRDYDANSSQIAIDTSMLERLLHALDARSVSGWYHPAMRIQNELIATKEREYALKERLKFNENILIGTTTISQQTSNPINTVDVQVNDNVSSNNDPSSNDQQLMQINEDQNTDYFQIFYQHIEDRDNELNQIRSQVEQMTNNYRSVLLECDELKIILAQFKENPSTAPSLIDNNENEQQLRIDYNKCNKKLQFLKDDYNSLLNIHRKSKEQFNLILYEMKKELLETKKLISQLKLQLQQPINNLMADNQKNKWIIDENLKMKEEISILKCNLSKLSTQFLKNIQNLHTENLFNIDFTKMNTIGIITDNLPLEYITKTEYCNLQNNLNTLKNENSQLNIANKHMEKLLQIFQEQLHSQQNVYRKYSEEEINLKHLIVDLQCENNEKFIIIKKEREIDQLKFTMTDLEQNNEQIKNENLLLNEKLKELQNSTDEQTDKFNNTLINYDLQLRFLKKSLIELQQNYNGFMPLYPIIDFIQDYGKILSHQQIVWNDSNATILSQYSIEFERIAKAATENVNENNEQIEDKISLLKYQSQCSYLETQLRSAEEQIKKLYDIIEVEKLKEMQWSQHWKTIELLFIEKKSIEDPIVILQLDKSTQIRIETNDIFTQTDEISEDIVTTTELIQEIKEIKSPSPTAYLLHKQTSDNASIDLATYKSMESQLKQALILASTRSSLLLDTENRLAELQSKIKVLERLIESKDDLLKGDTDKNKISNNDIKKDDNILSATISSLQTLLLDKDQAVAHYQELLKIERNDLMKSYNDYRQEINQLHATVSNLELKLQLKEKELQNLHLKVQEQDVLISQNVTTQQTIPLPTTTTPTTTTTTPSATTAININNNKTNTNDFSQLSDKFIEDMFRDDHINIFEIDDESAGIDVLNDLEYKLKQCENEKKKIQLKLNDMNKRVKLLESNLLDRDNEIMELNERINNQQIECIDITDNIANHREIDQLKELLQDKDKHIQDLTDTLRHFHDDQQQFINDTTLDTVEQVSQLSADLNRSEATNRILTTQIEALKRQMTNINQRESQARDVIKTLKNQLIKRPVISIKPERNNLNTNREEQLQKRINQLEYEMNVAKDELEKQMKIATVRRNRDTAELGLWERQKRSQLISEKLKMKLNERETELEKLKNNFATAKSTIARLEREKLILENRVRNSSSRYCQSPSCPNIHTSHTIKSTTHTHSVTDDVTSIDDDDMIPEKQQNINREMIDILKSRVESQQRKIVAMELEGKGTNTLTIEYEKLQKKIASVEAQNLRLEAKNLQFQLDLDMNRQNDSSKRTNQQIKHLEDYILSLKEELSRAHVLISTNTNEQNQKVAESNDGNSPSVTNMQQTILSLRRVIERLKVENKNLKDGKNLVPNRTTTATISNGGISKEKYEKLRTEINKIQQLYSEALDKISALKIELEIQNATCKMCKDKIVNVSMDQFEVNNRTENFDSIKPELPEIQILKDKLIQNTQLLEKAKILLTRAAAKDKHLRERTAIWKHRCSELQNVPVIEEASE